MTTPLMLLPCLLALVQVPQAPQALSPEALFKKLAPSVFVVESLDARGKAVSQGSAVGVSKSGVVTNRHVVQEGVSLRLRRGDTSWPARIAHLDPDHDLAQLEIDGFSVPPVTTRPSTSLRVGERVYAIGSPQGLELTLSEGLISGLRSYEEVRIIQTSAALSQGSSGGGLFDSQGRLVGRDPRG